MKNTKKLLIATIMLVFAFVAAVSSTFAWFTMQQEAEVSNLELQAAAAGTDLQVSLTGEDGSYGYTVSLATTGAKLVPVTYDKLDNKFYQLTIDDTAGANKGKYKYEEATAIAPGTAEGADNEGYLVYDLYFKTSSEAEVKLMLDMNSIFVADGDDNILGTLRLMFVPVNGETFDYTNAIIYEHNYDENSTFGTGDYFVAANNYIAYNAFTHTDYPFLNDGIVDGKYTLKESFFAERKYTTNEAYDDSKKTLALGTIDNKNAVHYSVRIWLEGWDGDTTSEAATQKFVTYMRFFTTVIEN